MDLRQQDLQLRGVIPGFREIDASINATGTELLTVIERRCAGMEHQIRILDNPSPYGSSGSTKVRKADKMPRETGFCH